MTKLALSNPIAILMLCLGLLVFAGVVTPRMAVDTFPELTPPVLVVGTLAPGLGPKDMEKTITWRIEKYVSATPGVDHVESTSRNNLSIVFVWMKWGTDLNSAQTLVQQQVQFAMAAVPKSLGVLPPFVLQYDPSNAPIVQVALWGEGFSGPQLYDYAFNNVEPQLEGISGVASASLNGGRQRQINVVVDPAKAQARGLTADDVSRAVAKSNALMPSGEFISPQFDANVYTNAIPKDVSAIGNAAIDVRDGMPVLIRDVAVVQDGGTPPTQDVTVNGMPGVYLNVLRVPGGNTLEIVEQVKAVVTSIEAKLPSGMRAKAIFDQSVFVRTAYMGLRTEVWRALALIALVILLFLQSIRGTLIVAIAIPLSFAITVIVLYAHGDTLNAFTLGGLTLAMGRLVDDAVVVLESIHRYQRRGMSIAEAALRGTNAVAIPVLASMLTTIVVLLPVMLLAGLARRMFVPLAVTVAVSMLASYFVSIMVTPVACKYFLKEGSHNVVAVRLEQVIDTVAEAYARCLRLVISQRAAVIVGSAILVVASGWLATRLPSTFFPEIDESMERIYVRLAPGVSLQEASKTVKGIGELLKKELPDGVVELVLTNVGSPGNARSAMTSSNWGPNMGFIRLALVDAEARTMSQRDISAAARSILSRHYPGVDFLQWPGGLVASVFSNGYYAPMVLEVRNHDLTKLEEEANSIAEVARTVPGIRDTWVTSQSNYPEIHVDTDREKAGLVGVNVRDAAQTTLNAVLGNINAPSVWIDGSNGQSYYVVTFLDPTKVADPNFLSEVPIRVGQQSDAVTLGSYGRIWRDVGPVAVERNQLERVSHVEMQTEGRDIGTAAAELTAKLRADPRTRGFDFNWVGQVALMRDTFSGLGVAISLAILMVFMIMASQFRSLRLPFVMLFTIPVSLVGIDLALLAAGQGFSITALMGILMVVGIAVSNGILLVDDANRRFQDGAHEVDAVIAAARSRFVPIMMTSIATIIGLIPTAFALERGTESNQPLALAVVGGLTSSTALSLFLVPVMFLMVARRNSPEPVVGAAEQEAVA
ncbi:MAG TPA: efflux RND transporter permease subunit [Polyangiaceae bacterium]